MISVVIVTLVLGLLDQEYFSSWKFSATGWLGKLMMLLFCNFCCQHSLLYYWKNNPCKTLILFSWCRKKKSWKTCQFFVDYTFHDSSTLFLKHKIPLQHRSKNMEKKDLESKLRRRKSQAWNKNLKEREREKIFLWRDTVFFSWRVSPSQTLSTKSPWEFFSITRRVRGEREQPSVTC